MKYTLSSFKDILAHSNLSWDIEQLIKEVLERIDNPYNDDEIWEAIDSSIIYYDDQWKILKEYCSPQEANWDYAINEFIGAVFSIVAQLEWED